MKNNIILFAAIALAGCSSNKTLIKQSDVCISNQTETQIWFLNCDRTSSVARAWRDGLYGPALVQVVDSTEWLQLEKRAMAKR